MLTVEPGFGGIWGVQQRLHGVSHIPAVCHKSRCRLAFLLCSQLAKYGEMGRVGRIANATAQFPFIDPASGSDARKDVALHIHQVVPILMGRRRRKEEAKRAYKSTCVEEDGTFFLTGASFCTCWSADTARDTIFSVVSFLDPSHVRPAPAVHDADRREVPPNIYLFDRSPLISDRTSHLWWLQAV